jgi:hypothetical protein
MTHHVSATDPNRLCLGKQSLFTVRTVRNKYIYVGRMRGSDYVEGGGPYSNQWASKGLNLGHSDV